jgi:hypothetical protein
MKSKSVPETAIRSERRPRRCLAGDTGGADLPLTALTDSHVDCRVERPGGDPRDARVVHLGVGERVEEAVHGPDVVTVQQERRDGVETDAKPTAWVVDERACDRRALDSDAGQVARP